MLRVYKYGSRKCEQATLNNSHETFSTLVAYFYSHISVLFSVIYVSPVFALIGSLRIFPKGEGVSSDKPAAQGQWWYDRIPIESSSPPPFHHNFPYNHTPTLCCPIACVCCVAPLCLLWHTFHHYNVIITKQCKSMKKV